VTRKHRVIGSDGLQNSRPIIVCCLILLACAIGGCAPQGAGTENGSAKPVVRLQSRPRIRMTKAKEAPPDHVMQMELEFAMRDQAQFDQLMNEINDPRSSRYQQWLTPEEMHQKFGESQSDFDAVLGWLKSQGFTITDQSYGGNEDYIRFSGTVAQVDKAFQTHIMEPDFELYAPREDPVIPAQFAGVIARIDGLDNVGFRSTD
jgi:subtilase family serine protease